MLKALREWAKPAPVVDRTSERGRAQELAECLGTIIPGEISMQFWSLTIMERLTDKVIDLEKQVKELKRDLARLRGNA